MLYTGQYFSAEWKSMWQKIALMKRRRTVQTFNTAVVCIAVTETIHQSVAEKHAELLSKTV